MTNRIRIFAHNNGNAVNVLKTALAEAVGANVLKIKAQGSTFQPRSGDLILNYGSSQCPNYAQTQGVRVLNSGQAIASATNKRTFFSTLENNNAVPLPEFTNSRQEAQRWVDDGATVYARTVLQGHSGEGIVVCGQGGTTNTVPQASLYTKGITGARREYRIHVFKGQVILVQKKQRRSGYQENPNYSETVRNLDGGWVFGVSTANPSNAVRQAAVATVSSLGLDFGAVDIIAKGRQGEETEAYVLEVNTAPGQGGESTTNAYVNAIMAVYRNEAPYAPYGRGGASAAQAAQTAAEGRERNPVTAEVATSVSNQRSGSNGTETPTEHRNSAPANQQPAPSRAANNNTATAQSSQLTQLRMVDVINGDRNQIALEQNGSYYLFGEEVPVEVRNIRTITASL